MIASLSLTVCVPGGPVLQNPSASAEDARDVGSIPGLGRSPGVGNSNPLQYSCLENSTDRGVWPSAVLGVAKCQTRLSTHTHTVDTHTHTHTHTPNFFLPPSLPSSLPSPLLPSLPPSFFSFLPYFLPPSLSFSFHVQLSS